MNCKQIERLIPIYIGGELNPRQVAAVRQHTESCERCKGLVAEFEASQNWLRDLKPPEFDDVVFDNLRAAVREEIARKCGMRNAECGTVWNLRFALAAMSVLAVLAAGFLLYHNHQKSPDKSLTVSRRENLETHAEEIANAGKVQQIPRKKVKATRRSHRITSLPVIALNNHFGESEFTLPSQAESATRENTTEDTDR